MIQAHIDKNRVITACQNYLRVYQANVEAEVEKAIAEHMAPHTSLFVKLFGPPPAKSRGEAIARMKERGADIYSEWKWIHLKPNAVRSAERMLELAEATALDFVVLDDDSSWILSHE
jgi:hypothetical protein